MQEKYAILKKSEKNNVIGYLYLNDNKMAKITLNPKVNVNSVPAHFKPSYLNRVYTIDNSQVHKWIGTRIPPQYRQDISDVLKSLGLNEYDEYKIFKAYKGKSVRDDYYIEKVNVPEELKCKRVLASKRGALTKGVKRVKRTGAKSAL